MSRKMVYLPVERHPGSGVVGHYCGIKELMIHFKKREIRKGWGAVLRPTLSNGKLFVNPISKRPKDPWLHVAERCVLKLSWLHTSKICSRRQDHLRSPPSPYNLCHSNTMKNFNQQHWWCSSKHQCKCSHVYWPFLCLWSSQIDFPHKVFTSCIRVSTFRGSCRKCWWFAIQFCCVYT